MNPFLGVFFHWLGGLASGSFYVPYKGVKKWSWETYWLVGGFFSWIICPSAFAYFMTSDLIGVLKQQSASTLWWTYFFGAMWGFGGLTFGLTMRYLGMSLGMGVALGYCAAFGTLVPPIFKGEFVSILHTTSGQVILSGVLVCLLGIGIAALAGLTKEREMPEDQKKKVIKEFNFKKGILVATFSGIMSACFAFALQAGGDIRTDSLKAGYLHGAAEKGIKIADQGIVTVETGDKLVRSLNLSVLGLGQEKQPSFAGVLEIIETNSTAVAGIVAACAASSEPLAQRLSAYASGFTAIQDKDTAATVKNLGDFSQKEIAVKIAAAGGDIIVLQKRFGLWQGLPPLVVLLLGGFTTNFIWCVLLNLKNRTGYQYLAAHVKEEHAHHGGSGGGEHGPAEMAAVRSGAVDLKIPVLANYFFSALAGTCWYLQFFFYTMGATQMGKYDFASWTLHMASIIIFSTMWGWIFHEWKGSSKKAHLLIAGGIATLVLSTCVIGLGTAMNTGKSFHDILKMILGQS